jgi:hypothetical protein
MIETDIRRYQRITRFYQMIARACFKPQFSIIFVSRTMSRPSREEKIIIDLYNHVKTYREITKATGTYPREISTILKKADLELRTHPLHVADL